MLGRGDNRNGVWLDAEMCDWGRAVGWFNVDFQMPALDLNSGWQGLCSHGGQRTALCLEDLMTFVHLKRPVFLCHSTGDFLIYFTGPGCRRWMDG